MVRQSWPAEMITVSHNEGETLLREEGADDGEGKDSPLPLGRGLY
jgi:hypothetical protein